MSRPRSATADRLDFGRGDAPGSFDHAVKRNSVPTVLPDNGFESFAVLSARSDLSGEPHVARCH